MSILIQLRRYDTSTPWGFRMNGGTEFRQPLHIQKVTPGSISFKGGLEPGDVLLQIGRTPTPGMSHEQAKMEIIRAGNDVDFIVQRGPPMPTSPDSGVSHESAWHSGGPAQNPGLQSRSFKILQHQMAAE